MSLEKVKKDDLKSLYLNIEDDTITGVNLNGKNLTLRGGGGVLIDKTITANGTYNASQDGADGYKKVVVNVPRDTTDYLYLRLLNSTSATGSDIIDPIPYEYFNETLDRLPSYGFYNDKGITKVTLPSLKIVNSLIGSSCFDTCNNLITLDFGNSNISYLNKPNGQYLGRLIRPANPVNIYLRYGSVIPIQFSVSRTIPLQVYVPSDLYSNYETELATYIADGKIVLHEI